jgi:uracil-DNA glycosylase
MPKLKEILTDTIAAVEQMKRDGVTHVDVSPATLAELGKKPRRLEGEPPGEPKSRVAARREPRPPTLESLAALEAQVKACVKCRELSRARTNVVFGTGNPHAELMFVGEAPGRDEDLEGEPFVGRAGELLTKIIQAMGFTRHEVYIANVLKCRPPENRVPLPDEVTNCIPYLQAQIDAIQPKVIVALGATAVRSLLDVQIGISKMRGNWYTYHGVPIMPTFHPAYLLRNPAAKKEVWQDMQTVLVKLGREVPKKS